MDTKPMDEKQNNQHAALPGMGTILYPDGVAFRVWAPFASSVFASGTFNGWNTNANPFTSEGNGYWYVEVPGAKIGDEYKFVICNGDQQLMRNNPYASEMVNSSGNAIIHNPNFDWEGDAFTLAPWNQLVIYEMHVGTFNDLRPPNLPGTFDEIIPKLPYLRNLGINAIEIMPVMEYPMDFSWGYNPAHPFSVETSLGGPQGLFRLVKEAHKNSIGVIMDVVYNHLGPGDLDLWQFDGWHDDNHNGGIYFYDNARAHTPWGDTRPDYGRPEVRQYLRDNVMFWLGKYHIDGLRFDSVVNIRTSDEGDLPDGWSLLQWMNNDARSKYPGKITIAEDLQDNEWITKDTGAGGAGFGSQWDADFVHTIRGAIVPPADEERDMEAVRNVLVQRYNTDAFQRVIYTESHDEDANGQQRVPEEIWPGNAGSWYSRKRSTLGAALVFTAPGIPMIFQGQEFLADKYFRDVDRLDWTRLKTYSGIQQLYCDLIGMRQNNKNQTAGLTGQNINAFHVNDTGKLIAFHRWDQGGPGDDVIVVANFANQGYGSYTIGFPRGGKWRVRFNSDWQGYSSDFGNQAGYDTVAEEGEEDGLSFHGNIGIGPYSVLILSQDPQ